MTDAENKIAKKRKAEVNIEYQNFEEKEVEIFLKIFVELAIKEPEDIKK